MAFSITENRTTTAYLGTADLACSQQRRKGCAAERRSAYSLAKNTKHYLNLAMIALALGLALAFTPSCASSNALHRPQSSASNQQQLPFHQGIEHNSDDASRPNVPPAQDPPRNSKPFIAASRSHTVPAGTLVTIRLLGPLVLSRIHAGDAFSGSVADPLVINGDALVENGDPVTGRIESTQPPPLQSCRGSAPGYVRLALNTITVDGAPIPLQTLSLFAKATLITPAAMSASCDFELQKSHLLTFRLSAPLTISQSQALAKR